MNSHSGKTVLAGGNGERQLPLISAAAALLIACIVLMSAPFSRLVGPGPFALAHLLHSLMAFLFVIISSMGLYLAVQLTAGQSASLAQLKLVSTLISVFSGATIIFGNWLYVGYRANTPDSAKTFFLETRPEVHHVFFEFKEHAALYTLPLAIAATFIIWHYREKVLENYWLRFCVSSMLILNFVYFAIAFGLGAAIAKLRGV